MSVDVNPQPSLCNHTDDWISDGDNNNNNNYYLLSLLLLFLNFCVSKYLSYTISGKLISLCYIFMLLVEIIKLLTAVAVCCLCRWVCGGYSWGRRWVIVFRLPWVYSLGYSLWPRLYIAVRCLTGWTLFTKVSNYWRYWSFRSFVLLISLPIILLSIPPDYHSFFLGGFPYPHAASSHSLPHGWLCRNLLLLFWIKLLKIGIQQWKLVKFYVPRIFWQSWKIMRFSFLFSSSRTRYN